MKILKIKITNYNEKITKNYNEWLLKTTMKDY